MGHFIQVALNFEIWIMKMKQNNNENENENIKSLSFIKYTKHILNQMVAILLP
jgi:hypothetical protein